MDGINAIPKVSKTTLAKTCAVSFMGTSWMNDSQTLDQIVAPIGDFRYDFREAARKRTNGLQRRLPNMREKRRKCRAPNGDSFTVKDCSIEFATPKFVTMKWPRSMRAGKASHDSSDSAGARERAHP